MNTRRNRVGSNQYKVKKHKRVGLHLLSFYLLMNVLGILYLIYTPNFSIISPVAAQSLPVSPSIPTATKSAELKSEPEFSQESIEDYIKVISGKDAKVAIAVMKNECNPQNKAFPKCYYRTEHEKSIGIFQINLESSSHWIHASKVPGQTIEEKIKWLYNPYNNTLVAYKIFQSSGFEAWSAYKNGNYLRSL